MFVQYQGQPDGKWRQYQSKDWISRGIKDSSMNPEGVDIHDLIDKSSGVPTIIDSLKSYYFYEQSISPHIFRFEMLLCVSK